MPNLRLVGVHQDGQHLLLADPDGARYELRIDQALRDAIRRDRGRTARESGAGRDEPSEYRPRDIQTMIRSGLSLEDIAERSGWPVEKVQRYEPPVRAERDHVALVAQELAVARSGEGPSTFGERVLDRLARRGVAVAEVTWDAWRADNDWSVVANYAAGGRMRRATWQFDPAAQTLRPTDDEARWLSEDDAPQANPAGGSVFDLEADGGLDDRPARPARRVPGASRRNEQQTSDPAGVREDDDATATGSQAVDPGSARDEHPSAGQPQRDEADPAEGDADDPVDLVSVMRERSKGRRRGRRRGRDRDTAPAQVPAAEGADTQPTVPTGPADDPHTDPADDHGAYDDAASEDAEHGPATSSGGRGAPDHDDTEEIVVPSRPAGSRKSRPGVPSWDDIMFGADPRDDG